MKRLGPPDRDYFYIFLGLPRNILGMAVFIRLLTRFGILIDAEGALHRTANLTRIPQSACGSQLGSRCKLWICQANPPVARPNPLLLVSRSNHPNWIPSKNDTPRHVIYVSFKKSRLFVSPFVCPRGHGKNLAFIHVASDAVRSQRKVGL